MHSICLVLTEYLWRLKYNPHSGELHGLSKILDIIGHPNYYLQEQSVKLMLG
jgi:hypothetical protein